MCSHATVTDSDLLSLIGTYDWDLYFYLLGRSTHQNLMSCSRILNSIKGFKLNQYQWSNITTSTPRVTDNPEISTEAYRQILPGMSSRLYPTLVADSSLDAHVSDQQDTLQMQLTTEVDKYLQERAEK